MLQTKKIESFIQETNGLIGEIDKKVSEINSMIPFAEMTMDDYRDAHPEGFMRTDIVTTWPHTEESQEDLNEEEGPTDEGGH